MGIAPSVAVALFALAAGLSGPREVSPQVATDRTYLTFSCPTRLPGAVLPAGTYLFVTLRSVGGQSLIDVYTADASQRVARVLGIDGVGQDDTTRARAACPPAPQPRRGWFNIPHARDIEFVYSTTEAAEASRAYGVQLPYSVLPVGDLELVGAYPVAGVRHTPALVVAGAGGLVSLPAESSRLGALAARAGADFGAADHITAARLIVTERAGAWPRERTLLKQLGVMLDTLQRAARERQLEQAGRLVIGIESTLANLNPPSHVLAKYGVLPPPRDFVLTLERIGAHVRAFARVLPAATPPAAR